MPALAMSEPRRTLRGTYNRAAGALAAAAIDTAGLDARLLVSHALSFSHEDFVAMQAHLLGAADEARIEILLERRLSGEPVARIVGSKEFWGRDFGLGPETLVPRPESELLVEAALDALRDMAPGASARVADLGTGSGCLLISVLADDPRAWGLGIDISLPALRVAAANAARHGVADRACFAQASWLDALAPGFDVVMANPPYIASATIASLPREVARFDPRRALDGGPDGLAAIRAIAKAAPACLRPGGVLLVEVGFGQCRAAAGLLADRGLVVRSDSDLLRDLAGIERVVRACRSR